jgi:hypothetical protein
MNGHCNDLMQLSHCGVYLDTLATGISQAKVHLLTPSLLPPAPGSPRTRVLLQLLWLRLWSRRLWPLGLVTISLLRSLCSAGRTKSSLALRRSSFLLESRSEHLTKQRDDTWDMVTSAQCVPKLLEITVNYLT